MLTTASAETGRRTLGSRTGQAHAKNRQARQPGEGQGTDKGGKRVNWEILVGFGAGDPKAKKGHSVSFRKRGCTWLWGLGTWGQV